MVDFIKSNLHANRIEAKFFEIEITESVIENSELVIPQLNSLKRLGVGISIDDFGTGYSSLHFVNKLPIDTLKIDKSFIRDMLGNDNEGLLVKAIIDIGNTLKLTVVAEGIETEKHLNKLVQLNCSLGQGYYFSKPLRASELELKYLKKD
ncbi:EAL domain-containing protein [Bacillus sp. JCM 19034]|uniref:EAL domain-containing protein n=1 Tax=Bacillus sp. JCM 19034 TaxID=1481928 RepID=UPI0022B149B6|nr:EAL domain-containing protein [Bacillus sp. JCM 19034]